MVSDERKLALSKCKTSPTGSHVWEQCTNSKPIFVCRYCLHFRAFNIRFYLNNPYGAAKFQKLFTVDELPALMMMVHEAHKHHGEVDYGKDIELVAKESANGESV